MHSGRPTVGSGHHAKDSPPSSSSSFSSSSSGSHHRPEQPSRLPHHPHHRHAAMLSAGASSGPAPGLSLFRGGGSLTHGEPRVLAAAVGGGQYNGAGAVTGGALASLGPYSPLCSVHGQSSPLASVSPYTGFFSQYPSAAAATASHYSPTSSLMASARLPPIESYSAVLASMGTHVQHAASSPGGGGRPTATAAVYHLPLGQQYSHHHHHHPRFLSSAAVANRTSSSPGPSAHSPCSSSSSSASTPSSSSFSVPRERESLLLLHRGGGGGGGGGERGERDHHSPPHPPPPPSHHPHHPHNPHHPRRSSLSSDTPPEEKKLLPSPGMLFSSSSSSSPSSQRRGSPGGGSGGGGGLLKEVKHEPRDSSYHKTLPSGKEGSLKHRILTSDMGLAGGSSSSSSTNNNNNNNPVASYGGSHPHHGKSRSHSLRMDEDSPPSGKRARYGTTPAGGASMPSSSSSSSPPAPPPPTDPHVFVAPHAVSQGPVRYSPSSSHHHQHHHHHHHHQQQQQQRKASPHSPSSASYLPHQPEAGASPGVEPAGSGNGPPPPAPPPPALHYPPHFLKGSIIQLANGDLKRVEDLQTEDFVSSAQVSADLKVDSSTVVRIEEHPEQGTATLGFSVGEHRVQVTVEATLEHPFFVFGRGWSSCSPEHTLQRYHLECHKLSVGDVCISLTHKDVPLKAAEIVNQQQHQQQQQQQQHQHQQQPVGSPLKLEEESKKPFHDLEDPPSLKRSPGHQHSTAGPEHEPVGDNNNSSSSRNGSPSAGETAGGSGCGGGGGGVGRGGENDDAVDLTNVPKSNRDFTPTTKSHHHNPQNTDHYVTSQTPPSSVDGFASPSDVQGSETRRWSTHDSDASNDDRAEVAAKSGSDTNQ